MPFPAQPREGQNMVGQTQAQAARAWSMHTTGDGYMVRCVHGGPCRRVAWQAAYAQPYVPACAHNSTTSVGGSTSAALLPARIPPTSRLSRLSHRPPCPAPRPTWHAVLHRHHAPHVAHRDHAARLPRQAALRGHHARVAALLQPALRAHAIRHHAWRNRQCNAGRGWVQGQQQGQGTSRGKHKGHQDWARGTGAHS
jgi:hypothetical protein